ncbi:hypothetical protein HK102_009394 [Quaeritorhiza haematococci]|nr:hypothetical protein HK102_009394 [Quaeritorhiza haematococci]
MTSSRLRIVQLIVLLAITPQDLQSLPLEQLSGVEMLELDLIATPVRTDTSDRIWNNFPQHGSPFLPNSRTCPYTSADVLRLAQRVPPQVKCLGIRVTMSFQTLPIFLHIVCARAPYLSGLVVAGIELDYDIRMENGVLRSRVANKPTAPQLQELR